MLLSKLPLSKNRASSVFVFRIFSSTFSSFSSEKQVNKISRVLSDYRELHHDIEEALTPFSSTLSTDIVQQVIKRSKNLGFSAHRFFLWAKKYPGFQPDHESYKILISVLGSSKQFPLIWDLLDEMLQCGDVEITLDVFRVVFDAYCKANLPDDAIRAFYRMPDFRVYQNLEGIENLLYLLCKNKFVSHGQEFFDDVKGKFEVGSKCFTLLIRAWGEIGDSGRARKVFDEMSERGCDVDVAAYNGMLEALCNSEELEDAYTMFRGMLSKGLSPDAFTFSIFIRSYCKRDNVHAVFQVLDRMKRYNLVLNVFTYNCIIKRLCENGMVKEACTLLDEMAEAGVFPDTWSYNAIMAKRCEDNEVHYALKLLSRMKRMHCAADKHTYNMLLKMLIKIGRYDKVEEVWNGMTEVGFFPSVSTYSVMIHGLLNKRGKLEEACKYFESMIDDGIPPYSSTLEKLRSKLVDRNMKDMIAILASKMSKSTSSSIKEMAATMRGRKSKQTQPSKIKEDIVEDCEDEAKWPFRHDAS